MTIREIRFDGFSPVAVLDNGTFDTFDAAVSTRSFRTRETASSILIIPSISNWKSWTTITTSESTLTAGRRLFTSATKSKKNETGGGLKLRRRRSMVK